jgi:hypothetical protein
VGWKETNEYEDKGLMNVERAGFEPGNNVWKRQLLLGILGCCFSTTGQFDRLWISAEHRGLHSEIFSGLSWLLLNTGFDLSYASSQCSQFSHVGVHRGCVVRLGSSNGSRVALSAPRLLGCITAWWSPPGNCCCALAD